MKKIVGIIALSVIAALGIYCFTHDFKRDEEAIYFNGDIVSMKDSTDKIEAIYVKDGKIVETGSKEAILRLKSDKTRLIDLQGKTLMPGFFDPHGHFDLATIFGDMVDISGIKYRHYNDVLEVMKTTCQKGKKDEWIFFYGLDPALTIGVRSPTIQYLDSIAPDKPVVVITKALHVFYANSKAFSDLGITDKTPDPSKGSYYERDAHGKLTGGIIEQAALEPIRLKIQEIVKKNYIETTQKVLTDYARMGVTSLVNMGMSNTNNNILTLYEHIAAQHPKPLSNLLQLIGKLPERRPNPRIFLYLRKEFDSFLPETVENGDDYFKIMGIKMWYDGSPYSGSMFLKKPYINSSFTVNEIHLEPNHTGVSLIKPADLQNLIEKYNSKGWPVAIHAQGDIANEEVIQAFENLYKKHPLEQFRNRIEHCMLLPKSSAESLKKMGITVSFHINHLFYYGEFLGSNILGKERASLIFPIQSIASQGIRYSLHADNPQFYPDPFSLMSTSVNRKTESGLLINPSERVSIWQALKSMTIDAAWQLHLDDKLGTIEKGKYADLVILDKNPMKNAPENLSKIQVLETIVAGNTVWKK